MVGVRCLQGANSSARAEIIIIWVLMQEYNTVGP